MNPDKLTPRTPRPVCPPRVVKDDLPHWAIILIVCLFLSLLSLLFWPWIHPTQRPEVKISPELLQDFTLEQGTHRIPTLPNCKTVETDWGQCVEAGTYEGNPILLFGHRPYLYVKVTIDFHGATMNTYACKDGGLCADKLPSSTATIVVPNP